MPDNTAYLILGLIVVVAFISLYVVGLALRFRAARHERRMIEQFKEK